jgi:hypothetical protein
MSTKKAQAVLFGFAFLRLTGSMHGIAVEDGFHDLPVYKPMDSMKKSGPSSYEIGLPTYVLKVYQRPLILN